MSAKMVFAMFPGQGSQHVGMGKDLFQNFKIAREVFEEASDAVGRDLKKLCFDGPESDLTATENTQPCLLTTSVAAFRIVGAELGLVPAAGAGHSLGEYSALVAAGTLPLATAARWVHERGKSMQTAVPLGQGTMAAILGMEDEPISRLCARATELARTKRSTGERSDITVPAIAEPANYNSAGQTVIAGSTDAIEEAVALVKSGAEFPGGKAIPLTVSAPFHCRLMKPARERMAELFGNATGDARPKRPAFGYYPNRTARLTQEAGTVFEFLVEQVDHPVMWRQTLADAVSQGYALAIEFGPGKVLAGLAKRAGPGPSGKPWALLSVGDSAGVQALSALLKT